MAEAHASLPHTGEVGEEAVDARVPLAAAVAGGDAEVGVEVAGVGGPFVVVCGVLRRGARGGEERADTRLRREAIAVSTPPAQ